MKETIFVIIWAIFWLTLESTVLLGIPFAGARCDMILIAVVAIGFLMEGSIGLLSVFIMGIISDGVSSAPFGIFTFVYIAVFCAIRFAHSIIYVNSAVARFTWVAFASIVVSWFCAFFFAMIYRNSTFITQALWHFIPQALWSGFLGIFFIPFFNWYMDLRLEKFMRPKGLVVK